ncbi:fibrocystin [Latimeria chalumnae]|uniref:fibrocystin n=1 Tax=Latimeria chalumnae TaxID=7897 RepID=UPI00313D2212
MALLLLLGVHYTIRELFLYYTSTVLKMLGLQGNEKKSILLKLMQSPSESLPEWKLNWLLPDHEFFFLACCVQNLISFLISVFIVVLSVRLSTEPKKGSTGGGTWITLTLEDLDWPSLLYSINGSQIEVSLVNNSMHRIPCDVTPVYSDLSTVKCRTRPSWQEGLYFVELISNGQNVTYTGGSNCFPICTFQFSIAYTPVIYQVNPAFGVPGNIIQVYGWIITGRYETHDFNKQYIDGPVILEAERDRQSTVCSFANRQLNNLYTINVYQRVGTLQCRAEGSHKGSQKVSFSVFNKGSSVVSKDAWLISAKQELFLYQTHSDVQAISPVAGSLGGGSYITITGDFFSHPASVTIADIPCTIRRLTPNEIICTTGSLRSAKRLTAPQPGNRGLLFEVWDGNVNSNLTEASPGYRWQIVPNASSPLGFLTGQPRPFSTKLRGFFVAPETNNYTFWILAAGDASLYLSQSEDPVGREKIASIPAAISKWIDNWEWNWDERWQQKSRKLELARGRKYYLEALGHGWNPNNPIKVGVQLHNTWLTPEVVNTYYRERHEIRVSVDRLPEIQRLTVSGTGWISVTWDNVSSSQIPTDASSDQVQSAVEEILSVNCEVQPSSSQLLLQAGFEKGAVDLSTEGSLASWTEPFCGRFSILRPKYLFRVTEPLVPKYDVTKYTHVCFAYKGYIRNMLKVATSYNNTLSNTVEKNITCQWNPNHSNPGSWKYLCIDLWRSCVNESVFLETGKEISPVYIEWINLISSLTGDETVNWFYLDEVIVADTNVRVFQVEPRPARPGGNLIETISVTGVPPSYVVKLWVANCGIDLPLIALSGAELSEGSTAAESNLAVFTRSANVNLTVERLQAASPPLGGTFKIYLLDTIITGVSVHISSQNLQKLLQINSDNFTALYLNASDFTVSKDYNTCFKNTWTLTWPASSGDFPNFINASNENITGLNPYIKSRVVYDGGVFIGPIFGDMLATANNFTQVAVHVNDIPANCSGSCVFQYLEELTPIVSDVHSSIENGKITVLITGSNFTENTSAIDVQVNQSSCEVSNVNKTHVTCSTNELPLGVYEVTVVVKPFGYYVNASGDHLYLRINPRLFAIDPSEGPEIGGFSVTLTGTSLDQVTQVWLGSQVCPVNKNDSNSTSIKCTAPARVHEDYAVNVTVIVGNNSAVLLRAFSYDPSLNPIITSLDRNTSNTAGDQLLSIQMSGFDNYTGLDVKVEIQDMLAFIQEQTPNSIDVLLPALPPGLYHISVFVNGINITANGTDLVIQYISEVNSVQPCCGSLLGGTDLIISGKGFSANSSLVSALLNGQVCNVFSSDEESIQCTTPPVTNLSLLPVEDIKANVTILIGNILAENRPHGALQGLLEFKYQVTSTPVVTNITIETQNDTVWLYLEGTNLTNSMAILGDFMCEVQPLNISNTSNLYNCSLPLNILEVGVYTVKVLQKQLGYANITSESGGFTVRPQIMNVSPSYGSACGGTSLTISGIALNSSRNLSHIILAGSYTCEAQDTNFTTILCIVKGPCCLEVPAITFQTFNVTVTVNSVESICTGNCSFSTGEEWTPIVYNIIPIVNGSMLALVLTGQRFSNNSNEVIILVDDHLTCYVTSANESVVECQLFLIYPGNYSLSVFHQQKGQACFRNISGYVRIVPQILNFNPKDFGVNGGGRLTIEGAPLRGSYRMLIRLGYRDCIISNISYVAVQCTVPVGYGTVDVIMEIDNFTILVGKVNYTEDFTPVLLSASLLAYPFLFINISNFSPQLANIHIFIGEYQCMNISGSGTVLQCQVPQLPTAEYPIKGNDLIRGQAFSNLTVTPELTIIFISPNFVNPTFIFYGVKLSSNHWKGQAFTPAFKETIHDKLSVVEAKYFGKYRCLDESRVTIHGSGFNPGNTTVTICGTPCNIITNTTTVTALSCLTSLSNASLAALCSFTSSCEGTFTARSDGHIQCDVTVQIDDTPFNLPSRFSPKVEGDEVLIYNSSCNITIATEAVMECEVPNQPITTKIAEILENWGQNLQSNVSLVFCGLWSQNFSWLRGHSPQDGDNVTVERGQTLLLDITTRLINFLHIKGGRLFVIGPGEVEIHARYILVSDGGELRIGSPDVPFSGKAQIILYGSSYTPRIFPYGAKFLAVRNATLAIHAKGFAASVSTLWHVLREYYASSNLSIGEYYYSQNDTNGKNGVTSYRIRGLVPNVSFAKLVSSAQINDTSITLDQPVDWQPGDIIVISGTEFGNSGRQDEVVTLEMVNNSIITFKPPLRNSHIFLEQWITGQRFVLQATAALLSRNIVVHGNLTGEQLSHLQQCRDAGITGNLSKIGPRSRRISYGVKCLYDKSEHILGSRDLGATLIVQAFKMERAIIQLEGVEFQHVGQAFQRHISALNIVGNASLNDSYIRGCSVWNSFGRGIGLTKISDITVEDNILYNILGHGLLVGDGGEKGMKIRRNVLIRVVGTDGLSNMETLAPTGVYIKAPSNFIESTTVCAAGYGFFYHLPPGEISRSPLSSFNLNTAHSCLRLGVISTAAAAIVLWTVLVPANVTWFYVKTYGLMVYPEYQPLNSNLTDPAEFQGFTAWKNQGGVKVSRCSNLTLRNLWVYSCKDFGVDIVESLGNTSVSNSYILNNLGQQGSLCIGSGLKTPGRYELLVSNTTFVNFNLSSYSAIRTCSGCYTGQGGFSVKVQKLRFVNSPFKVTFPFHHSAILEDIDGSLSGQAGNQVLASMNTIPASCQISTNLNPAGDVSVCGRDVVFHRMSIGLQKAPETQYSVTVTNNNSQSDTLNYVWDTLSNLYGWMALLVDQETYTVAFNSSTVSKKLQYFATFDNFDATNYLLIQHRILPVSHNTTVTCQGTNGYSLLSLPSPANNTGCDWLFNSTTGTITYLVVGMGRIKVYFKMEAAALPTTPAGPFPSGVSHKWSLPDSWEGVEEGWGGYNHTVPSAGDDVIILPNRTIVVDVALPLLRRLYILGTLKFPVTSSNILSAACIVVLGGSLIVGSSQAPLGKEQKLQIILRASEGVHCDHLKGVHVDPGSIGVYGKLQIYSAYPEISWTHLGADIFPENERMVLKENVQWHCGDKVVIASSSYDAHQVEFVTLEDVQGQSIRIRERLHYRHIGSYHVTEEGTRIHLAAEVGLLTRNVQIISDVACTGRISVGQFRDTNGELISGIVHLFNVEVVNLGPKGLYAVEFNNISPGSAILSSSIHYSCGGGIHAVTSSGILLHDNVVYNTTGHGLNLEGQNHIIKRNLIVLTKQPERLIDWVAGIKINFLDSPILVDNVVAGSERIGFHINGQWCFSPNQIYIDNVAHSSLHGVHLYTGDGFQSCTKVGGFLSYKNYDYGIMFHIESTVVVENMTLVDNMVGLLPMVYGPPAQDHKYEKKYVELRNSVVVATSSTFDCIRDRIQPATYQLTDSVRAPENPYRGRVGILWPAFTSEAGRGPSYAWHKFTSYPAIWGTMILKGVSFAGFTRSCYSDDRDICIMSNPDSVIMHPVTAEGIRMLRVKEQNKFYFHIVSASANKGATCPVTNCGVKRNALFKDLDGSTFGLPPPSAAFPRSMYDGAQPCSSTGTYRKEDRCDYKSEWQGYLCEKTNYIMMVMENLDANSETRNLSSVVAVTDYFVDIFTSATSQDTCCNSKHLSTFYSVLPVAKLTKVCFSELTPQNLRLYLIGGQNQTKVTLTFFYDAPQHLRVYYGGTYVPPIYFTSESQFMKADYPGANSFSYMDSLLYVHLQGDTPVEIHTNLSIQVTFASGEIIRTVQQNQALYRLADFLGIDISQIWIVHTAAAGETASELLRDSGTKRGLHCPSVLFCENNRKSIFTQQRATSEEGSYIRQSRSAEDTVLMMIEIGDPPLSLPSNLTENIPFLSSEKLNILSGKIVDSQQTGALEEILKFPVNSLVVTYSVPPPEVNNTR